MKYTLLILLLVWLAPAYAIQFNRCVDSAGNSHYTNLPLETLDANCKQQQNYYSMRFNSDYQRLKQQIDNPQSPVKTEQKPSVIDQVKTAIEGVVDADMALEQLLENTRNARQNPASDFFRARTEAITEILKAD